MTTDDNSPSRPADFWTWRLHMAERIAALLDPERFGVVAMYVVGSTKNGTAGPSSDIDLLIHHRSTPRQLADLRLWLEGWSLCLDELNCSQTGSRTGGLLDVHLVTDRDIAVKSSYAVRINSVTDPARPLSLGSAVPSVRPKPAPPSPDFPDRT